MNIVNSCKAILPAKPHAQGMLKTNGTQEKARSNPSIQLGTSPKNEQLDLNNIFQQYLREN